MYGHLPFSRDALLHSLMEAVALSQTIGNRSVYGELSSLTLHTEGLPYMAQMNSSIPSNQTPFFYPTNVN